MDASPSARIDSARHGAISRICGIRLQSSDTIPTISRNIYPNMARQTSLSTRHAKDESVASIPKTLSAVSDAENGSLAIPTCLFNSMPRIYKALLRPLDLSFGLVREKDEILDVRHASQHVVRRAIVKGPKAKASVCFVVKRPGCVLCFEQGAALSDLIAEFEDNQVGAWAVVKEVVDPEGVLNLYQQYFRFPFFLDAKRALYTALGERRIKLLSKKILKLSMLKKRCKEKGIEGNILGKGEGMILGGVIVFDRRGNIRYAHQEQFSHELPVDEIRAAIRQVVDEETAAKRSSM